MLLDIEKIRQLVDMMVTNDLVELSLRDGDVEVKVRRPNVNPDDDARPGARRTAGEGGADASAAAPESAADESGQEDVELVPIKSPMVGTVYTAPNPESPPFVQVGSEVNPGTVVCIVEAMKVFNEIKAEVTGTIERILMENEQSVEYGQPLFLVRPA